MKHVVLAALAALVPFAASADGHLPDLEGREIVVVTENAYPPLQFIDPVTGMAIGWEYDALEILAERLNFTPVIENISWDAMIPAVSEAQYDMGMTGITIREDRDELVDFSAPYMVSQMRMLVAADEDRFATAEEFAADEELLIGSQAGTTPFYVGVYDVLDGDEGNPRIVLFETIPAAIQALMTEDVDMVLADSAGGQGYVSANPDRLQMIGDPLGTEEFGFIFPNDSDLVAAFDAGIESMREDGTLAELDQRWFVDYALGQ
ncbi:transporter substrate-binding domain-containing protein [Gymnodinialimonas hymeniacidonis]|uniref:transporter substrate-binding domain-containing protein n=1 Tax=Gymnodinialimonas hymeniacidonis TaxID=3126508 RepID=UPI0034C5E23C